MKKNEKVAKARQGNPLPLHREDLRVLAGSELRGAVGGSRVRIPVGFAGDTTPLYDDAP
jgi:hypothetical protein